MASLKILSRWSRAENVVLTRAVFAHSRESTETSCRLGLRITLRPPDSRSSSEPNGVTVWRSVMTFLVSVAERMTARRMGVGSRLNLLMSTLTARMSPCRGFRLFLLSPTTTSLKSLSRPLKLLCRPLPPVVVRRVVHLELEIPPA